MGDFFSLIWTKILDLGDVIREFVGNMVEDFRESNRYFKIKVGLIATYVVVSLVTVVVFLPPGELNDIDARVRLSKTEIIGGRYVLVANEGADPWRDLIVTLNGRYSTRYPIVRPGKKKTFFFGRFGDSGGQAPGEELNVRMIRLDCSEGAFERDYARGE